MSVCVPAQTKGRGSGPRDDAIPRPHSQPRLLSPLRAFSCTSALALRCTHYGFAFHATGILTAPSIAAICFGANVRGDTDPFRTRAGTTRRKSDRTPTPVRLCLCRCSPGPLPRGRRTILSQGPSTSTATGVKRHRPGVLQPDRRFPEPCVDAPSGCAVGARVATGVTVTIPRLVAGSRAVGANTEGSGSLPPCMIRLPQFQRPCECPLSC